MTPILYSFGGLPGTGKSTLAAALARRSRACCLRIDSIEQTLRDEGFVVDGPVGYCVGYRLALDNLQCGISVIADCVNPLELTRAAWRNTAREAEASCIEIEITCSDLHEHRQRIESRSSDLPGLKLPTWQAVLQHDYRVWNSEHLVLDTAGQNPARSCTQLFELLEQWKDRIA